MSVSCTGIFDLISTSHIRMSADLALMQRRHMCDVCVTGFVTLTSLHVHTQEWHMGEVKAAVAVASWSDGVSQQNGAVTGTSDNDSQENGAITDGVSQQNVVVTDSDSQENGAVTDCVSQQNGTVTDSDSQENGAVTDTSDSDSQKNGAVTDGDSQKNGAMTDTNADTPTKHVRTNTVNQSSVHPLHRSSMTGASVKLRGSLKMGTEVGCVKSEHRPTSQTSMTTEDDCDQAFQEAAAVDKFVMARTMSTSANTHRHSACSVENNRIANLKTRAYYSKTVDSSENGNVVKVKTPKEDDQKIDPPKCSCHDCGKEFATRQYLIQHIKIHSKDKSFTCAFCDKTFTHRQHLDYHMPKHTGKKYACQECGKRFSAAFTLKTHMLMHTGERRFKCGECGKAFKEKGTLGRHAMTHSGERPNICGECGMGFIEPATLRRHMLTHTGEMPFPCSVCGLSFRRLSTMISHKQIHTGEKLPENDNFHASANSAACPECDAKFNSLNALHKHMICHVTYAKPYICFECCERFSDYNKLKTHTQQHAPSEASINASGLKRSSKSGVSSTPMSKQQSGKSQMCPDCRKDFQNLWSLLRHRRCFHGGHNKYTCLECNKCYRDLRSLQSHVLKHSDVKDHACPCCSSSYSEPYSLWKHIDTHGKFMPFICLQCSMGYKALPSLTNHLKIHTAENLHKCPKCEECFRELYRLQKHVALHKKPHRRYNTRRALSRTAHIKLKAHTHEVQHKKKPNWTHLTCRRCIHGFVLKSDLESHIVSHGIV